MQVFESSHAPSARPRSVSASAEDMAGLAKMQQPQPIGGYVVPATYPAYGYAHLGAAMYPPQPFPYGMYDAYGSHEGHTTGKNYQWTYATPHPTHVNYYLPSVPRAMYPFPTMMPTGGSCGKSSQCPAPEAGAHSSAHVPQARVSNDVGIGSSDRGEVPHGVQRAPGTKNLLDIAAIESGMDTRTTVMIKNIPNKMTDRDLKTFIDRVCPRRIDFLYLRMDFQNGEFCDEWVYAKTESRSPP